MTSKTQRTTASFGSSLFLETTFVRTMATVICLSLCACGGQDLDGDGFGTNTGDCDDQDGDVNPDAREVCDGKDNDCDGEIDEGDAATYYSDLDDDGFGDENAEGEIACEKPPATADNHLDCDDGEANTHPGADEICDTLDNDCDGEVDEDGTTTYYPDLDDDGFGDATAEGEIACEKPPGTEDNHLDCDDGEANTHPGAYEICDTLDNDCDGEADEGQGGGAPRDAYDWYLDSDGDGHGDENIVTEACDKPDGYSSSDEDCNDSNPDIHPQAEELCNGIDDDCDGSVDEDVKLTFHEDEDGDEYGDPQGKTENACSTPPGYVDDDTDCDDHDATVYPGAVDFCSEQDNDCDGEIDEDCYSQVSTGAYHACAVAVDRAVVCWGAQQGNDYGQTDPPDGRFIKVSSGGFHSCGLREDESITCWGRNNRGQLDAPTGTFLDVAAGSEHSCGVRSDGTLACWGDSTSSATMSPDGTFGRVEAGAYHNCALDNELRIACWGEDENGYGHTEDPSGYFIELSAGSNFSCGLRQDNSLECWGSNADSQLNVPSGAYGDLSAGNAYACAVDTSHRGTCWGSDLDGRATVPNGERFEQISASLGTNTCALKNDGSLTCWGSCSFGVCDLP